jgi:plasmid maintenance system antidote protein VapI
LNDLKEYQQKHEAWQSLQEKIQLDQATTDAKFAQRVGYESYKIRKMAAGVGRFSCNT